MIDCLRLKNHQSSIINHKSSEGFTLLELIVVFSVIAILSTIGIASFVTYSRTQALDSATLQFENTVNQAKSESLSQVKPDTCPGQLSGYEVDILNSTQYSMSVICGSTIGTTTTLPTNISFTTPPATVFFPVLSGGVQVTGISSGPPWNIALTAYGLTKTVTIDSVGNIY